MEINKNAWNDLYKEGYSYMKYPNEVLVVILNRLKNRLPADTVCLDYGFGSGNNSEFLIGNVSEFYGLEISEQAREIALERLKNFPNFKKENLRLSNNEFLPEFENKFDLVVAWQVLSYNDMKHLKESLENIYKYLKKGGLFITTLATERDASYLNSEKISNKNEYKINDNIPNQEGCIVVIPDNKEEFENYFSDFETVDIGHYENVSYFKKNNISHYYGVFRKQ